MPRINAFEGPTRPDTPVKLAVKLNPASEVAYWWIKPREIELGEAARTGLILSAFATGCRDETLLTEIEQNPLIRQICRTLYPDSQEIEG